MRLILALAGLLLLCGCNVVMTKAPLFKPADSAGAPQLRPGVWLFIRQPGCKFDEAQPFVDWPECAGGGLATADDLAGHQQGDPKNVLQHAPYVLVGGDPQLLQVRVDVSLTGGATVSSGGASSSSSATQSAQPYVYAAVHPTKLDPQGRIIALSYWPVDCGPPPPKDQTGASPALGTLKPLPGMVMKPGDAVCTTASIPALHAAAKASRAWADQVAESHWVRDGTR